MKAFYIGLRDFDVYTNMAIDEYFYKNYREPVLRFYEFSEPSVTIGYNQRYKNKMNEDFIKSRYIPLTRRLTGGRTVFHDGDLTYSISSDFECFKCGSSNLNMIGRYKKISDVFYKGFNSLGIDVTINEKKSLSSFSSNCFDTSSIYELSLNQHKIVGSAQVFSEKGFLQQGTILVKNGVYSPSNLYGENIQKNIENLTGIVYNIKIMAQKLFNAFFRTLDFEWGEIQVNTNEADIVQLIEFYKNREWIERI